MHRSWLSQTYFKDSRTSQLIPKHVFVPPALKTRLMLSRSCSPHIARKNGTLETRKMKESFSGWDERSRKCAYAFRGQGFRAAVVSLSLGAQGASWGRDGFVGPCTLCVREEPVSVQWGHIFPDQGSHWLMLTSVTVCGQARGRETCFLTQKTCRFGNLSPA